MREKEGEQGKQRQRGEGARSDRGEELAILQPARRIDVFVTIDLDSLNLGSPGRSYGSHKARWQTALYGFYADWRGDRRIAAVAQAIFISELLSL